MRLPGRYATFAGFDLTFSEDVQLGTPAAERLRELRETMDGEVLEVNPMDRDAT